MKRFVFLIAILFSSIAEARELLNASYDPTRELYQDYNQLFSEHWKEETGEEIIIKMSHGGSGKQARSVIDGLKADVASLALAYDIDLIAEKSGLIKENWQTLLPNNSSPYTSTIVFLVRKGNPKKINDWDDLTKDGVQVITPNPKTSGGARWNYVAAWGFAMNKYSDEEKAKEFMKKLFLNVPILDTGARGSTITFSHREIGDVLISWENEAFLALEQSGGKNFEIVLPKSSILAEPSVALVEKVAEKNKTSDLAKAYLEYLYSKPAQKIIAKHHFRPRDKSVLEKDTKQFPELGLFNIEDFGGWKEVQKKHFDDGGIFDQIFDGR